MEVHLSTLEIIVGALAGLGVLLGGAGYLLSSYRDGRGKPAKEKLETENLLLDNYEKQVKGFKEALDNATKELKDAREENVKLKTINEQLIKVNEQYLSILQNRNPEMDTFMQTMIQAAKEGAESHKKIVEVLKEMQSMSASNHEILAKEQNKDLKIEATVSKK